MSDRFQPSVRDVIFISYRKKDTWGTSGRVYDTLRLAFGNARVFRDSERIGAGKWKDQIEAALARSVACVAVMGPRWADPDTLQRLHEPDDMVRFEIRMAIGTPEMSVIPTLVEGATIPLAETLPADIRALLEHQCFTLSEQGWGDDLRRLIHGIRSVTKMDVERDLESILQNRAAASACVEDRETALALDRVQRGAARRTVDDLLSYVADATPAERSNWTDALSNLSTGDSQAVEEALEREYVRSIGQAEAAATRGAQAALNVANLALLRDLTKAVAFYRKAQALRPTDPEINYLLGSALVLLGDSAAAETAFLQALEVAIVLSDNWKEMAIRQKLGALYEALGSLTVC